MAITQKVCSTRPLGAGAEQSPEKRRLVEATEVSFAALPKQFTLPLQNTALVMIDIQKDFCDPQGFGASLGNDVSSTTEILEPCAALLAAWRQRGGTVVHTLEAHLPDLSDCHACKLTGPRAAAPGQRIGDVLSKDMGRILIRNEPGNSLMPEVATESGEKVLFKPGKGAFYNTDLEEWLQAKGITHLVFTGISTEVCVQTSMREANDRGFECVLLEDCTASYFPEFKKATLAMVRAQGGIVGWTASSKDLIAALP